LSDSSNMAGRAVLVTGASTGIGAACAFDLADSGFRVFAGVRSASAGETLRKMKPAVEPVLLDVTQADQIAAAAEHIAQATGTAGLYGLVNNAGIVVVGPLELIPIDELRRQLEVNVVGQVAVTQAMLPMIRQARGRIVNIGSFNGLMAPPYFGPYAASKHAMEAITDSLRMELRQWGIRVSIIEPGSVSTPIWDKSQRTADHLMANVPDAATALYGEDIAVVQKTARTLAAKAMPVSRVTRAVRRALTSRWPWTRYPVGAEAWGARRWARLLPDFCRDFLLCNGLGLKRKRLY